MKKTKLLIYLYLLSYNCFGANIELNQKVEVLARSFPIGAFSKFTVEGLLPLWGKRDHPKDITYGFFGAQAEVRTSAVVNYLAGQIFVYPIPILGLFAGRESGLKEIEKIDTFDCTKAICQGKMRRDFLGAKLALGYKDIFFMSENRWSNVYAMDDSKYFVDEITTLLGSPGEDKTWVSLNILGMKLSPNTRAGLLYLQNKMQNNKSKSQMLNGFYEYSWGENSLISSTGIFETRENQRVGTLLFLYSWKTPSQLKLF